MTNEHNQAQELSLDNFDLDNLDAAFESLADVAVAGGFDADNADDGCEGGACKI
ncbi:MAG: hypothetical protein Q4E16_02210 [Neisseria sp.]|nr:hypothetical protein [Neisseria sp.]